MDRKVKNKSLDAIIPAQQLDFYKRVHSEMRQALKVLRDDYLPSDMERAKKHIKAAAKNPVSQRNAVSLTANYLNDTYGYGEKERYVANCMLILMRGRYDDGRPSLSKADTHKKTQFEVNFMIYALVRDSVLFDVKAQPNYGLVLNYLEQQNIVDEDKYSEVEIRNRFANLSLKGVARDFACLSILNSYTIGKMQPVTGDMMWVSLGHPAPEPKTGFVVELFDAISKFEKEDLPVYVNLLTSAKA